MSAINDIKDITSVDDLKNILTKLENELSTTRAENAGLSNTVKGLRTLVLGNSGQIATPGGPWDDEKAADFGSFFAFLAGNRSEKVVNRYEKQVNKALLGTPLTGDATTGSYLVPEQYISDVFSVLNEQSELFPLVTKVEHTSNSAKYPKKNAGVSFTRVTSEGTAYTEASPTFTELDLDVLNYALWISVHENWLEDSLPNVGRYFFDIITEALVESVDTNFLNSASNPTGLMQASSVNSYVMDNSSIANLDASDVQALVKELTTRSKRKGARFIMHMTILDIIEGLKDATGRYIFHEATESMPKRIFGYPAVLSDEMPALADDAASTGFIGFGNPKHLIYGDRKSLEVKLFDQTAQNAKYGESIFRAVYRASFTNG